MPDLTSMLDLRRITELFKDPARNAEEIQRLGPGFSSVQVDSPPTDDLQPLGGGPATSIQEQPTSLASRDLDLPMLGSAEQRLTGQAEPEEKQAFPWQDLLSRLSVGLVDVGNAVGNPRAPVGGGLYEMNREYLRQGQMDQLRRRHDMFDDAYKQAQALPTEIYTDPKYAGLSSAKAALEKDAADGKIDNEKNVSNFLTEMSRAKRDLEQLQLETTSRNQLEAETRLEEGRRARELQERTNLEALVANPEQNDPDTVRRAQIRLNQLKASDMTTRNVGGQDLTLSQGDWAKYDINRQEFTDRKSLQDANLAAEQAMLDKRLASDERIAGMRARSGRASRMANSLRASMNAASRQIGAQMKTDEVGNPTHPDVLYAASLDRNKNAILNAAEHSGLKLIQTEGQNSMGRHVPMIMFNGNTYDMTDRNESTALLSSLYDAITIVGDEDF